MTYIESDEKNDCDDDDADCVTSMDKESLMVSLGGRHITPRNVLCAAPK